MANTNKGELRKATLLALKEKRLLNTPMATLVLALAKRLDEESQESAAYAVVQLSREFRIALKNTFNQTAETEESDDELDEMRKRRAEKM